MPKIFGIEFAPLNTPIHRRLQTLSITLFLVVFTFGGISAGLLSVYILFCTQYYWLIVIYAAWIYYDRKTVETGGRRAKWWPKFLPWTYMRDYFPLRLAKTEGWTLDPKRNYMFCLYPHGVLPCGNFGQFSYRGKWFTDTFPGMHPSPLTLNLNFYIPIFREYLIGIGLCSVSADSINYLLSYPDGGKIAVVIVGGAEEAFYSKPGYYRIILKRRRGFVRLALQNGSPLVPVFSFGETSAWNVLDIPTGSLLHKLQMFFKSITGIAPVVAIGRGFFQYSFGILPFRTPITTVVGEPIEVPKIPNPTAEQIDEYHAKFTEELIKLFESEKHKYLERPDEQILEIVQ